MVQGQGEDASPSRSNPSRSPAYSPTLSDTKIRSRRTSPASTSRSPDYVPLKDAQDRKQQRRSMSVDTAVSGDSRGKLHSSRSDTRERSFNSIEIKGLTKMVYATHLEQIFSAYGPIEEVFMPFDRYSEYMFSVWLIC